MDWNEIRLLSTQKLAELCANNTDLYKKNKVNDSRYCYELLHRAALGIDEAWEAVIIQYRPHILKKVTQNTEIPASDVEDVAQEALMRWQKNVLSIEKWHKFSDLREILVYLRDCINSTIIDHIRKLPPTQYIEDINSNKLTEGKRRAIEAFLMDAEWRRSVLECIKQICKDADDRLLIELTWSINLKPQAIAKKYPNKFPSAKDVSQKKRNLMDRIRRNPKCRFLFDQL